MSALAFVWIAVCVAGIALSIRSIVVLRGDSRWTIAGWVATAAYFAVAGVDAYRHVVAPFHAEYVALAALTVAFVVAGTRDERQAEPWWNPVRAGATGAERRARRGDAGRRAGSDP